MPHLTIRKGSKGPLVKLAQQRLNERHVTATPLALDGDFGPLTDGAVKDYQTKRSTPPLALTNPFFHLVVDHIVGPDTWFRLDPEVVKLGSFSLTVTLLQELLKLAGPAFDPGPADGDFGPVTHAKVIAFQAAKTLAQDGIVGPKTWAALNS